MTKMSSSNETRTRTSTDATTSPESAPPKPSASILLGERDAMKHETASDDDVTAARNLEYPLGWRLRVVYASTLLTMFLVALDLTIVATAIPKITQEFESLDYVGWYGSAFFLTLAVFQSPWGKIYKYCPIKLAYAASVFVFELGSLICGVSRNSQTLIAGRVITGVGGAGVTIGTYIIIAYLAPPEKAPAFIGGIGAVFSIASIVGPLVGGAFTGRVSWRWCFYINLPIGGAAILIFFVLFEKPTVPLPKITVKELALQLDVIGITFAVGSIVSYFLALEWGGVSKSWGDSEVVGLLVGSALLAAAFGITQWYLDQRASIIPRILAQRHVAVSAAFVFLLSCANFLMIYNLPIYFQSVKGSGPTLSGIQILPLIVSASVLVVLTGIACTKFPIYQIYIFIGASLTAIGAGLLYTLKVNSYAGEYIGFQLIVGFGNGIAQQIPLTLVQTLTKPQDLADSMSTVLFFQLLSGALSVAASQSVFINRLLIAASQRLPEVSRKTIITTGATDLQRVFTPEQLPLIQESYLIGLRDAWALAIAFAGAALLTALLYGFKKIEKLSEGGDASTGVRDRVDRQTEVKNQHGFRA
ncbi:putative gliotoxin efflux pump [Xylaria palmicola]|nr:putative gliotoxin efflux pump [Xylaria palmicola]